MKLTKVQKNKPNVKTHGMSELMSRVNVKKEGNMVTYSFKDMDELRGIRERMKEIYSITYPLRTELKVLSTRHNKLLEQISGVKIEWDSKKADVYKCLELKH